MKFSQSLLLLSIAVFAHARQANNDKDADTRGRLEIS
jgi:hypothetical protein